MVITFRYSNIFPVAELSLYWSESNRIYLFSFPHSLYGQTNVISTVPPASSRRLAGKSPSQAEAAPSLTAKDRILLNVSLLLNNLISYWISPILRRLAVKSRLRGNRSRENNGPGCRCALSSLLPTQVPYPAICRLRKSKMAALKQPYLYKMKTSCNW